MTEQQNSTDSALVKFTNPLVFISHDTRDAKLAEEFSNLLKNVSAGVLKSFRSSDRQGNQGIEFGTDWFPEIIKSIRSASDVVCLLTERSVNRPWILFEAGMAKGMFTPILGVALGIELKNASTGPFFQFQNCADDEESLTKLVLQLVNRIPGSEPDRDTIRFHVGKFRSSTRAILKELATSASTSSDEQKLDELENSSAKLFEEIKIMFQDLPSRIEGHDGARSERHPRRINPVMAKELMITTKNPAVRVLVGLSLLRDLLPWVYDEGCSILAQLRTTKSPEARKAALIEFDELLKVNCSSPYVERYLIESKDDYILLTEVPRMIRHALEHLVGEV